MAKINFIIFAFLVIALSVRASASTYLISGEINESNGIELDFPIFLASGQEDLEFYENFSIGFLSDGIELKRYYFPVFESKGREVFSFSVDIPENINGVKIYLNEQEIHDKTIGTNRPIIGSFSGDNISDKRYILYWNSSDIDNDELRHNLFFRINSGNWDIYASDYAGDNMTIDLAQFPEGEIEFKLQSSDFIKYDEKFLSLNNPGGLLFAYADIMNGSIFRNGTGIFFKGYGFDSGASELSYSWSSSVDGVLSSESFFMIDDLSIGEHIIRLEIDNGDLISRDEKTIRIVEHDIPDLSVVEGIEFYPEFPRVGEQFYAKIKIKSLLKDAYYTFRIYDNYDSEILYENNLFAGANSLSEIKIQLVLYEDTEIRAEISESEPVEENIVNNLLIKDIKLSNDWCNRADINKDRKVGILDLSVFSAKWGMTGCSVANEHCNGADININGAVSLTDLSELSYRWGRQDCVGE